MELSERSVKAIAQLVCGDGETAPYRKGPDLVRFFAEFGFDDVYGPSFPSRGSYAEDRTRAMASRGDVHRVITAVLHPGEWLEMEDYLERAIAFVNDRLKFDGLVAERHNAVVRVRSISAASIDFQYPAHAKPGASREFVEEQLEKCRDKLARGDFDGAKTNARSFLEAVLRDLEATHTNEDAPSKHDGDLQKLYKRVQKAVGLETDRKDISEPLVQVLRSLTGIVNGISSLRNSLSDAHARSYRPARRHAELVVNAASTLATFLVASAARESG